MVLYFIHTHTRSIAFRVPTLLEVLEIAFHSERHFQGPWTPLNFSKIVPSASSSFKS